jgi:PhnB protein
MTVTTTTHLNFRGDARAALELYQSVFGGQLTVITYQDAGNVQAPLEAEQVMWGQVSADNGFRVMAYDVPSSQSWNPGDKPVFVSIRGDDQAEITAYWNGLADGGTILQPLGQAGWAPLYGMLKDRFGVTWVLDVQPPYAG